MPPADLTASRLAAAVLALCSEHSLTRLREQIPAVAEDLLDCKVTWLDADDTDTGGVPLRVDDTVVGRLALEGDGHDRELAAHFADVAAAALHGARKHTEAVQRDESFEAINEISHALLRGEPADAVLRTIAARARDLVSADTATVALPEAGDQLVLSVAVGAHADRLAGAVFPRESSVSGEVIHRGKAVVLDDAAADPHASQPIVRLGEFGPTMFVPLHTGDTPFGTLLVANLAGGELFSAEDLHIVEAFAAQASVAVEYSRAREGAERVRWFEERERLGRGLHEAVIRKLFAAGLELEQLAAGLARDDPQTATRLTGVVEEIDNTIVQIRATLYRGPNL